MEQSKWFKEKEKLEDLILVQNLSYEEIGRMYGCSGGNIKKVADRIGIPLPVRNKSNKGKEPANKGVRKITSYCLNCGKPLYAGKKHCCLECQQKYQHNQQYQLILKGDTSIMRANYSPVNFKGDILQEQNGVCAICGCKPEHNGKPLVFILDHIDGHASHNNRENLRCICPNCDSQLDTYKSKNKCGERSYYRYHKYENGSY